MYRAVLYISEATFPDSSTQANQLQQIRDVSSKANDEYNISGVLAFHNNRFLHVLEGEQTQLGTLLDNIKDDARNDNVSVIIDVEVDEKIFQDWEMIEQPSSKHSELMGYFLRRSIDELPLIEQQPHEILEEFVNEIFN